MAKRRGNGEGTIVQLKDGRWQGRITLPNGKRKSVYGKTYTECREKLDALKRQLADGSFSDSDLTVKQFLETWLEHRALEVKPKTLSGNRYQCKKYIIPKIGKVKLANLTPMKVQTLITELANEVSPSCANRSRKDLKTALNYALRMQLITRNPVDATKKLKEAKPEMTIWNYEEASRFLTAAKEHRLYPLFRLTMSTGMRIAEVLGLRWQDVKGSQIHIRHTGTQVDGKLVFDETTKTEHSNRIVSIPRDVVEVLNERRAAQQENYEQQGYKPSHDLVFDSLVGTPLAPRNLERVYKSLQAKADVPHAKFHDLRHWHASMLIEEGWDIRRIAKRLGHADPSITYRTYTHLINRDREEEPISLGDILPTVRTF